MTTILGIDPGLQRTGYGIVNYVGNQLSFVACGVLTSNPKAPMYVRLQELAIGLAEVIANQAPEHAAIEETFVNVNPQSTLKLGQARGALILALAQAGLVVAEYAPTLIKKTIVGAGRAEKSQIAHMVQLLLPGCARHGADAMDALAIAITHAHHGSLFHISQKTPSSQLDAYHKKG